jgi:hypothetical protein
MLASRPTASHLAAIGTVSRLSIAPASPGAEHMVDRIETGSPVLIEY